MVVIPCSRVELVRVSSKLAGTNVLDEIERDTSRVAMKTDFRTSSMERLPM